MFLILEGGISIETLGFIGAAIAAIFITRLKIFKEYFSTSKGLVENLKTELETLKAKSILIDAELKEMKEENKVLHREIAQRIEIHLEDQDTIRELKRLNG